MIKQNYSDEIQLKGNLKVQTLVGVLMILVSLAAYTLYTKGVSQALDTAKADVITTQVELDGLKAKVDEITAKQEELSLTDVKKAEILASIPIGINQDEVIRNLMELTSSYDIDLRSLSFGKGSASEIGIGILQINASFEGSYTDLTNFLEGLEKNSKGRMFKVKSISVQVAGSDVTSYKRAVFSLAMEAYFQQ